ncbi:MAG: ChaN family lipoprotein [Burkholderiales bacterium]
MDGTSAEGSLEGRIYHVAAERFVDRVGLMAELARADFVLLGERHDNLEHHRLQAELVHALQQASSRPKPVAFEMIPADRQIEVVKYRKEHPDDAAGLGEALGWSRSGWPDWRRSYAPIAQAALDAGAEIVAADLSRAQRDEVRRRGADALRPPFLRRTGLDRDLPPPLFAALQDEIQEAHCGVVPEQALGGMVQVQRARDAMLADRLAAVAGRAGGILIAGGEHVRKDRGVPRYLARLRPDARIVSLAFVETGQAQSRLSKDLPYDYLWFTEPIERADPCVEHREQLRRMAPAARS